tara:strand:+ start:20 stop:340 length:321 start_codon:yes stop_codon:yes gene_type:complete
MVPLGLQLTTIGALGGPGALGDPGGAVFKPDPVWECFDPGGGAAQQLRPRLLSASSVDNNSMWDFSGFGTVNYIYEPQDDSTHANEGRWEIASIGSPNSIQPVRCA